MATVDLATVIKRVFQGTAAPTIGDFKVGDRVVNIAPTAGSAIGWRCVTAGNPGTWEALSYQPLDSDLTSIAALTTTSYGRSLLELANLGAIATGSPGSTTFLRGDGLWAVPAGSGGGSEMSDEVWIDDFGGVADGVTSNSAALTAAIAALDPNRGGTVRFNQGRYYFATGVTTDLAGLVIQGEGNPGTSDTIGRGSTQFIAANGITWLTVNTTGAFISRGPMFRNFHLYQESGATTGNGILAQATQGGVVENVTVSDFHGGYGLKIDGHASVLNGQYWQLWNYSATRCLTGLHLVRAANGCRVFGGYFEGGQEGATATPMIGSKGIYVEGGDTSRFVGVVIQGWETGFHMASAGADAHLIGCRTEYCNYGVRISQRRVHVYGCSFDNFLLVLGSSGAGYSQASVGIQLDSGATHCLLFPSDMQSINANNMIVDNSGVATNEWVLNTDDQPRRKHAGMSAAPTTGTHGVGETVYHATPAAAGFMGWVCTTAGTPGTWKTWGAISS
jgi:hypothetical protein